MKSKFKIAVVLAVVVLALLSVLVGCNQDGKKPSVDGERQCKHTYGEWITTVDATCNGNGSKKRVCSTCKNEDVEVIVALGHDVIEHKAQAVTCTEIGWNAYLTCSRCDFNTYEEIKALGHDFEEKFSVDKLPTCTAKGIKSRHCSRCDATTEQGEIDELGHNIVQHEGSAPTCTGIGWGAYEACTRCDYSTQETIPAIGHDWEEEFTTDKEQTCTQSGSRSIHCTRCEEKTEVTEIPALGHSEVNHGAQSVTCTEIGWNEYVTCTRCNYTTYEEIPALGHDWEEDFTVDKAPTCTEKGSKSIHCTRCEERKEVTELEALGHKEVSHGAQLPTCTEVGWNAFVSCSRCDYSTYEEIPALGHDWEEEFTVDKAPTCTEKGSKSIHCTRCEEKSEITEIETLGHDVTNHESKSATCTAIGWNEYATCTRCDHTTYEEIPALGHDWEEEFTIDKEATCTEKGSKSIHCTRCEEKSEITEIEALGHNEVNHESKSATCTEIGWNEYVTCTRCDYTTYEQIDRMGHDFEEEFTVDKEATCTETGSKSKHCTRCEEKTEVTEIEALGHNIETHEALDPTCTEVGWHAYESCSRCDYTTYEEIALLGHDEESHEAVEPTCTEVGWHEYVTCSRCDYTTYEEIEALGHEEISHAGQAVTCTEIGWNEYVTCSRCDYSTYEEIEALGHDYINKVCKVCGELEVTSGLLYTLNEDGETYSVTGIETLDDTDVIIAHTFEGKPVTAIGEEAFRGRVELTSVIIQDSVTSVGAYAFCECVNLTCIEIPDTVTSIGNGAFYECSNLTSIQLPENLTEIAEELFRQCGSLTSVKIPDNVTSIGNGAFLGCSDLTTITFGDSVTSIGDEAFSGCSDLTDLELPDGLTSIGNSAFYGCDSLTSLAIPDSVIDMASDAFAYCGSLTNITVGADNTKYHSAGNCIIETATETLILGCETSLIPTDGSVTSIGNYAFSGCGSLATIEIPDTVTSIGEGAFFECIGLTEIAIHGGVTDLGEGAFYGCSSLSSVDFADGSTALSKFLFAYCNELTSINYDGTADEWKELSKESGWDFETGEYSVYCSDVIVTKDGKTRCYEHTYGEWETTKEANCTEQGSKKRVCEVCEYEDVEIIDQLGHDEVEHGAVEPTCTEIGWNEYVTCTRCDYTTYEEISALGHNYINRVCSRCGGFQQPTNGLVYTLNNDGESYSLTGIGEATDTDIVIPSSYEDKPVTSIGYKAFSECSNLTSVVIPESVKTMESSAFLDCTNLTAVYITDIVNWCGISFYDYYANPLYYAHNLYLNGELVADLVIPDNVEKISERAFDGCSCITSITVDANNTKYHSQGNCIIETETNTLILGCQTSIIPADGSVTTIGSWAFSGCTGLKSVEIPENVTSIERSAFFGCKNLEKIEIPNSVTNIDIWAFGECSNLTSVVLGKSVSSIMQSAFSHCDSLVSITVNDNNSKYYSKDNCVIDRKTNTLILGCKASILPTDGSVTSIGSYAFYCCSGLTSIEIPDRVTSIENNAFYGCIGLTSIELHDKMRTIGDSAFYECSSLTSIVIPDSVISLGHHVFKGCRNLTSVVISDCVTSIGDWAFDGCSSLTSVVIGDGVTSIGYQAFKNCSSLTSIYYGGTATEWQNVSKLNDWNVGTYDYKVFCSDVIVTKDGKTRCYEHTYGEWETTKEANCTEQGSKKRVCEVCEYEDIEIIDPLGHNYEENVCTRCDELKPTSGLEYTLNDDGTTYSVTGIGQATDTDVVIASTYEGKPVTGIGAYAFSQCDTLTSVAIPTTVTSMGQWAFSGCTALSAVYIRDIAKWCEISFDNSFSNPLIYGNNLYLNGESVTDLVIPDGVTFIGNNAFHDCTSIKSVEIPDTVTSIGEYAFYGCSNLMSAVIGNGLTSIEDHAFFACYKLVEIYNKSALDIAKGSLALGEIGHYAKEIYTEDYETKLSADENGYIFYTDGEKKSLIAYTGEETELTLPEDITEINHGAFYKCRNLTSVTIGDNVESIGENAFDFCSALTSVAIGNRVTRIGQYAFYECRALTSINFDGDVSEWQSVTKGNHWDSNIQEYTVYCNDGEIAKDGTVTYYN